MESIETLKELLSDQRHRIQLHDFVAQRTREILSKTGQDYFSVHGVVSEDTFVERLHKYEEALTELIPQEMLLCRWGGTEHLETLNLPLKRLAERITPTGGSTYLIASR